MGDPRDVSSSAGGDGRGSRLACVRLGESAPGRSGPPRQRSPLSGSAEAVDGSGMGARDRGGSSESTWRFCQNCWQKHSPAQGHLPFALCVGPAPGGLPRRLGRHPGKRHEQSSLTWSPRSAKASTAACRAPPPAPSAGLTVPGRSAGAGVTGGWGPCGTAEPVCGAGRLGAPGVSTARPQGSRVPQTPLCSGRWFVSPDALGPRSARCQSAARPPLRSAVTSGTGAQRPDL